MVLVANKVDLVHLRKITSEQGKEMAIKHNVGASSLFTKQLWDSSLCIFKDRNIRTNIGNNVSAQQLPVTFTDVNCRL